MTYPGTILKAFKLLAKKELGQNFLADPNTAARIVELAGISENDIVLEIGPGLGALTVHAAQKAQKVVAVEKDHRLIQHLENALNASGADNVEVIQGDVLKVDLNRVLSGIHAGIPLKEWLELPKKQSAIDQSAIDQSAIDQSAIDQRVMGESVNDQYTIPQNVVNEASGDMTPEVADPTKKRLIVLGNLPYNISSQVLFQLASYRRSISKAVLMFQKELAQRICSPPGGRDYGRLSAIMQYCSHVKILTHVRADLFFPKPDVESTVIEVSFDKEQSLSHVMENFLFKVIKAAFSKRRKTLRNALFGGELTLSKDEIEKGLTAAGIDPVRRAETLCVEEFVALSHALWPYEKSGDSHEESHLISSHFHLSGKTEDRCFKKSDVELSAPSQEKREAT